MSKKELDDSKENLQYLANIASVRSHINNIMSVSRGVVDQKTIHRVSGVSSQLDRLFVKVLLESNLTGGSQEEDVDPAKRVAEEKAKLAERKKAQQQTVVVEDSGVKVEPAKVKKNK